MLIGSKKGSLSMPYEKPQGQPARVLIVEDNPDHAELIIRAMREGRVDKKIYHVSDGEQAVNFLFHRGEYADPQKNPRPHLVLLDLRLPKLDGLEVLREIRSSALNGLPVVIFTSSEAERDMVGAYRLHANSYLVKPLDFDKFRELTLAMESYWTYWNRQPWKE